MSAEDAGGNYLGDGNPANLKIDSNVPCGKG